MIVSLSARAMLTLFVENHTNGPLAHFRGKLVRRLAHDASSYSEVGAAGKTGLTTPIRCRRRPVGCYKHALDSGATGPLASNASYADLVANEAPRLQKEIKAFVASLHHDGPGNRRMLELNESSR